MYMKAPYPILLWMPRVLGLMLFVFIGMFALDAFEPGASAMEQAGHFVVHLIPAFAVLLIVIVGWKRPVIGGTLLLALALTYAIWVSQRLDWILAISGPVALIGVLFILSKVIQRRTAAGSTH
jgi:hypothetical protein